MGGGRGEESHRDNSMLLKRRVEMEGGRGEENHAWREDQYVTKRGGEGREGAMDNN